MKKKWLLSIIFLSICAVITGCGGKGNKVESTPAPGQVSKVEGAIQVEVNNSVTQQTIEGFGAAYSCYHDNHIYYADEKMQQEVLDLLFKC